MTRGNVVSDVSGSKVYCIVMRRHNRYTCAEVRLIFLLDTHTIYFLDQLLRRKERGQLRIGNQEKKNPPEGGHNKLVVLVFGNFDLSLSDQTARDQNWIQS